MGEKGENGTVDIDAARATGAIPKVKPAEQPDPTKHENPGLSRDEDSELNFSLEDRAGGTAGNDEDSNLLSQAQGFDFGALSPLHVKDTK